MKEEKKTLKKTDWFQPKNYLHFDNRLSKADRGFVTSLVTDAAYIKGHAFYPFIMFSKTKYKTQQNDDGTKYLNKKDKRNLCYASHLDSQIYSYYADKLSLEYEKKLFENDIHENVIAFRELKVATTGEAKCNIHLAYDAFNEIKKMQNCKVYAFDITKFFDSLKKNHLKDSWANILGISHLPADHYNIFKFITSHAIVDRNKLLEIFKIPKNKKLQPSRVCTSNEFREIVRPFKEVLPDGTTSKLILKKPIGIPQGSPISAVLANIYMFDFDVAINRALNNLNGKYFRYCDDILCIVPLDADIDIPSLIITELANIELELNTSKSDSAIFSQKDDKIKCNKNIQYLGFIFDGVNIAIRPQSISRFRRNAKRKIENAKASHEKINNIKVKTKEAPVQLRRKKLIEKLTHHGSSNFISYGHRSAKIMQSKSIKGQMKKLDKFVFEQI